MATSRLRINTSANLTALGDYAERMAEEQRRQEISSAGLLDISRDLEKSWGDLSKVIRKINDQANSIEKGAFSDLQETTKQLYRNLKNAGTEQYQSLELGKKIASLQEDIANSAKKRNDYTEKYKELNVDIDNLLQQEAAIKKAVKDTGANKHTSDKAYERYLDAKKAEKALMTDIRDITMQLDEFDDFERKLDAEKLMNEQLLAGLVVLKRFDDQLERGNQILVDSGISAASMEYSLASSLKSVGSIVEMLPGGGLIASAFQIDKKAEEFASTMMQNFIQNLGTATVGAGSLSSVGGAMFTTLRTGAMSLYAALGPILLPLAAIGVALLALKSALDMDKETTELSKSLDVTKRQAIEIQNISAEFATEMEQVNINTTELNKTMVGLKDIMGLNVSLLSKGNESVQDLIKSTTLLVEKQGLSYEETSQLNIAAAAFGTQLSNVALMSETLGDNLVSGRDIMKDLSKVSKTVLINMSKQPVALIQAIKKAKLLGLEMNAISAAGRSTLDIETSLEAEMTANVLTGRHMNMNRVRQLALMGDESQMMDEMLHQLGTADDYFKLNVIQRETLAKAAGMDVEMLNTKMLKEKELLQLGYSQQALDVALKKTGAERASELAKIQGLKGKEVEKLLEQKYIEQDRVVMMEKLTDLGSKLMNVLTAIGTPLLSVLMPVVDLLNEVVNITIDTFGPALKDIGDTFTAMFGSGDELKSTMKTIAKVLAPILIFAFSEVVAAINLVKEQAKGIMEIFGGVKELFSKDTFVHGFKRIITGLSRLFLAPFQAMIDTVIMLANSVGNIFGVAKIPNLNLGNGVEKIAANTLGEKTETPGLATGGQVGRGGLSIVGEKGPELVHLPDNAEVLSHKNSKSFLENNNSNDEIISLLKELITAINQPVQFNISGKLIDELEKQMSMRRTYNSKLDFSYGTHG